MSRGSSRRRQRLNPEIVSLIWERFGEARADLFAARENAQCRLWFLCGRRTVLLGTDAFAHHSWPKGLLYAFPHCHAWVRLLARILSFLQYLLDKRRSASTIKGYAAAISACHEGFGNKTVFSHSLVKAFLTGIGDCDRG
ncbi:hypothetical protein DPEC_G00377300 [Dallia pectoralis]|nr:hypothetical protein DPEC_G00377300 [Dallia pectoralis]